MRFPTLGARLKEDSRSGPSSTAEEIDLRRRATIKHQTHELPDPYIGWIGECIAVQAAYEEWSNAGSAHAPLAFATYRAALDREERASWCLRTLAL
jgi:hypothetical protein